MANGQIKGRWERDAAGQYHWRGDEWRYEQGPHGMVRMPREVLEKLRQAISQRELQ
jgi:hypothetical protein